MSLRARAPLALVVSSLAACGDGIVTRGLEEPLAVHDAQFIEGPLPGSPPDQALVPPRPTAATTELTFLRPRLADVPFFGWTTLDAVSVAAQIEGLGRGYWVVPTGAPDPTVQGEPVRQWRFVADLHDSLPPGRHRLLVAATDAAGTTGSQVASTLCINRRVPDNGNVCDPKKAPPELVISLIWDRPVDLDLLVVTPNSEIVASRSPSKGLAADQKVNRNALDKNAPGVGFLDADSNESCRIDGRQIENVVFADRPDPGSYLVYVNLHDACGQPSTRYGVSRHTRSAGAEPGTFSVVETDRTHGTLVALEANGSTRLGTFVAELVVP
ncbi:MAG: hypothetical protein KF819_20990 [Labilithrix sp.]|nr:hypothetical protein [Labilithrix sp.]